VPEAPFSHREQGGGSPESWLVQQMHHDLNRARNRAGDLKVEPFKAA